MEMRPPYRVTCSKCHRPCSDDWFPDAYCAGRFAKEKYNWIQIPMTGHMLCPSCQRPDPTLPEPWRTEACSDDGCLFHLRALMEGDTSLVWQGGGTISVRRSILPRILAIPVYERALQLAYKAWCSPADYERIAVAEMIKAALAKGGQAP